MKFFKWQLGRQGSGYEILPIIFWKKLFFDCYLIKISEGIEVPPHNDPVPNKNHYRLNIHFGFYEGGKFQIKEPLIKVLDFLWVIRPDRDVHSLDKITKGNLYIFSIGWVTKN